MLSKVLQFQTSYDFFNQCFFTSRISVTLPPKIFGCVAFVHIHSQNRGKLAPKVRKCIFVRYSPTQNGYKCFDLILKKCLLPRMLHFFKNEDIM